MKIYQISQLMHQRLDARYGRGEVEAIARMVMQEVLNYSTVDTVLRAQNDAPGFFDDPAVRQAWCGCLWMGASMGHVDPLKEVNAAATRIANNITTQEQEASEYNGNNFDEILKQRKKEVAEQREMMQELGIATGRNENRDADETEDEEKEDE